ncbi:MAG: heme ABC transporter permease CcmC [Hydrotalea sp.]|nr:heme ABC transporter permease CcmC [Hydrotalea sp.]
MKHFFSFLPHRPQQIITLSAQIMPWVAAATAVLFAMALYRGVNSPPDYLQGELVKIMFIHVPAAYLASLCYAGLAVFSFVFLVWRHPMAAVMARAVAPVGLLFTIICLITGSLWGRPTWGTFWVWDARLTSVFILFLLYVGQMLLAAEIADYRAAAMVAVVGGINLPIIKFSVVWWQTLHQGSSLLRADGPSVAPAILSPLLWSMAGFTLLALLFFLWRLNGLLYKKMTDNHYLGGA